MVRCVALLAFVVALAAGCGGDRAPGNQDAAPRSSDPAVLCPDITTQMHALIESHRSCETSAECQWVYTRCLDRTDVCNGASAVNRSIDRGALVALERQLFECLRANPPPDGVCGSCGIGLVGDPPCKDGRCGALQRACPDVLCQPGRDGPYCQSGTVVNADQSGQLESVGLCVSVHDPERLAAGDRTPLVPEVRPNECGQFRLANIPGTRDPEMPFAPGPRVAILAHDCAESETMRWCTTGQDWVLQPFEHIGSFVGLAAQPATDACAPCSCTEPYRCLIPDIQGCFLRPGG